MHTCEHCDRKYKNAATLSSHKYTFHRDMASKSNVVAIVNTPEEIPSRQNPRKIITPEDEERERLDMERIMHFSGSSSDTDSSISLFSDDPDIITSTQKRNRTQNSSDEEPPSKVARKLSKKRKRNRGQSDEEPPSKVARKLNKKRKRNRVQSGSDEPKRKKQIIHIHDKEPHNSGEDHVVVIPKPKPYSSYISGRREFLSALVNKDDEIRELKQQILDLLAEDENIAVPSNRATGSSTKTRSLVRDLKEQIAELQQEVEDLMGSKALLEEDLEEGKKALEKEKSLRKKEKERCDLLTAQFDSYKENVVPQTSPLDKALNNSVTIDEINDIRHLISSGRVQPILDDEDKLSTIQKVISGMLEGIIPISNPQNLAFTEKHKSFMKTLERLRIDDVKDCIAENVDDFLEVFGILDMSLKLVTKAFNKYGKNGI